MKINKLNVMKNSILALFLTTSSITIHSKNVEGFYPNSSSTNDTKEEEKEEEYTGIVGFADYLNKNYLDQISDLFPMDALEKYLISNWEEDSKSEEYSDIIGFADYLNKKYLDPISDLFPMNGLEKYLIPDKKDKGNSFDIIEFCDYLNKNYLDEISNRFPMDGLEKYITPESLEKLVNKYSLTEILNYVNSLINTKEKEYRK